MESTPETRGHPLLDGVALIESALDDIAHSSPVFLDPASKRALLLRLVRLESRLAAVRFQAMTVADDVAAAEGARDVAALLTHHTRGDGRTYRRELALAQALDRRWRRVAAALAAGDLNLAQATVINHALDDLPGGIASEVVDQAEEHLVAEGAHYGPQELRVLGRRILDVVAPEVAERTEARQLDAEERRARETTFATFTRLGDGSTRVLLRLPDASATRLRTYLEAFTSPRHQGGRQVAGPLGQQAPFKQRVPGEVDRIPVHRRLGQAFCSLLEVLEPTRLPVHGGDATTLIVTVPLETLRHDLGTGDLGATDKLSAGELRRLACTAKIIPAVLAGKSEVLDLGRSARLFTPAQRKAMVVRDRECRAHGCTIPATWCEAHHRARPWAQGGRTDLADGILLCSWHHHRAHDPTYETTQTSAGDLLFHRRP